MPLAERVQLPDHDEEGEFAGLDSRGRPCYQYTSCRECGSHHEDHHFVDGDIYCHDRDECDDIDDWDDTVFRSPHPVHTPPVRKPTRFQQFCRKAALIEEQ